MEEKENYITWQEWNEMVYELKRYKWLYKIACLVIHDTYGTPKQEIDKELKHLWELFKDKENNKNDN